MGDDCQVLGFAPADLYQPGELIFVDGKHDLNLILANPPTAVATTSEQAEKLSVNKNIAVLVCAEAPALRWFYIQGYTFKYTE